MNKLLNISVFIFIAIATKAQAVSSGIKFESDLNIAQIKNKAKISGKYIFMDCYATWCGPCKLMDREVFNDSDVGNFMNSHFISVKVQMDSTDGDGSRIKRMYKDANNIKREFNIQQYPTYLFFSPKGEIVHFGVGALRDTTFIKLARNALKPEKQYFTLLKKYEKGEIIFQSMPYLANKASAIGNDKMAKEIARNYIENYLNTVSEDKLFTFGNIDFVTSYLGQVHSTDKVFKIFYENGEKIDSLLELKGIAQSVVDGIINREEITPVISNNRKLSTAPNWDNIASNIARKYNDAYAERTVLNAKLRWYEEKKNWEGLIKLNVTKIEKYGLDTAGLGWVVINNMIWNVIYKHCDDPDVLNKAIGWMEIINKGHPDNVSTLDTYANILYKAGRKSEAIELEQKIILMEQTNAAKEKRVVNSIFVETLAKMERNEPIWDEN